MNEEDKKRFARYYPGYVESVDNETLENLADEKDITTSDKKEVLGYIEKIDIDKDKLIKDTISHQ